MQEYELYIIAKPEVEHVFEKVRMTLFELSSEQSNDFTMVKCEDEGTKRLTYTIKRHDFGRYINCKVYLPNDKIEQEVVEDIIEDKLRNDYNVLRWLLVKVTNNEE